MNMKYQFYLLGYLTFASWIIVIMANMESQEYGLRESYRPGYVAVSPFAIQSSLNKQK